METVKLKEAFESMEEDIKYAKNGVDGTKKFICDICNFPFAKSIQLKSHKVTHGEKMFRCKQCEKCFATKSTMKIHEKSHETTRLLPETCDICKKHFRSSDRNMILKTTREFIQMKDHLNAQIVENASLKDLT